MTLLAFLTIAAHAVEPDFTLLSIRECTSGGTHTAWVQVANTGTAATSGTWIDVFVGRPSAPAIGEVGDHWRHTGALAPGEVRWYPITVAAPASGGAWIDVILDTDEVFAEPDELDNTGYIWSDFASCDLVDLAVDALTTPASACPGEDLAPATSLAVSNHGPVASAGFAVGWYLSDDPYLDGADRLLLGGRDQVSSVPADGSVPVGLGVNVVPPDAELGDHYVLAVVDELDAVSESAEWNNVTARPITLESCGPDVVALTAGLRQTCALLDDGAVRCWGDAQYGVLGYGDLDDVGDDEDPADAGDVPLGGHAVAIEAGYYHTCALLDTGAVRCWGRGSSGQLGYASPEDVGDDETPAAAGDVELGGVAVDLAAGAYHTCALLDTGAVRCWGEGAYGQLGYGNVDSIGDDEVPADAGDVPLGGTAVAVEAGGFHTCALMSTGALRCWGFGASGNLGYGDPQSVGDDETPASKGDVPVGGTVRSVSLGDVHTCAVLTTDDVRCWGQGGDRLGYGHVESIGDDETPASEGSVPVGFDALAVATGGEHSCALSTSGDVRCWGYIVSGGLGYASPLPVARPDLAGDIDVGGTVTALTAGYGTVCALLDTGAVRCWGNGASGRLGYGDTADVGDDETPADAGDVRVR